MRLSRFRFHSFNSKNSMGALLKWNSHLIIISNSIRSRLILWTEKRANLRRLTVGRAPAGQRPKYETVNGIVLRNGPSPDDGKDGDEGATVARP